MAGPDEPDPDKSGGRASESTDGSASPDAASPEHPERAGDSSTAQPYRDAAVLQAGQPVARRDSVWPEAATARRRATPGEPLEFLDLPVEPEVDAEPPEPDGERRESPPKAAFLAYRSTRAEEAGADPKESVQDEDSPARSEPASLEWSFHARRAAQLAPMARSQPEEPPAQQAHAGPRAALETRAPIRSPMADAADARDAPAPSALRAFLWEPPQRARPVPASRPFAGAAPALRRPEQFLPVLEPTEQRALPPPRLPNSTRCSSSHRLRQDGAVLHAQYHRRANWSAFSCPERQARAADQGSHWA